MPLQLQIHEPVACLSHLAGAVLFVVLTFLLTARGRGDALRVASLIVFGGGGVLLLTASGLFHMPSPASPLKEIFRRIDHAAIFVLIAATFTPGHAILYRGKLRWRPLAFIWSACLLGAVWKTLYLDQISPAAGILVYLMLGWVGAVTAFALGRRYGASFVAPLMWGAVAYTVGAAVQYLQRPAIWPGVVGPHELFHFAVLLGMASHARFVYQFADGSLPPWGGGLGGLGWGVAGESQGL
ncbi:MAG: hemolysin III family protein [Planctomycetia bacterium]|nr:hemolysin III family protein [Planctomycetia bacterium]